MGAQSARKLDILIVGARTGGLCLAHGLCAAGVDVRVFERDNGRSDRMQGYPLTINAARPISRISLRQILLEGLNGVVNFGKTFAAFEMTPNGRVVARFEDGSAAKGNILIGVDGVVSCSPVRSMKFPARAQERLSSRKCPTGTPSFVA